MHVIPNGGKMRFRQAFLNPIVFDFFYRNDTRNVAFDS
jgi:hypothetical protein